MPSSAQQPAYAPIGVEFEQGRPVGIPLHRQRDARGVVPQRERRREWWWQPGPVDSGAPSRRGGKHASGALRAMEDPGSSKLDEISAKARRTYQYWLDRSVIYTTWRWAGFMVSLFLFLLKIYLYQRWFIVTYGLGIFLLNNLIGFLSPQIDPEAEGPGLPTSGSDEFRPFSRRLPEFQFWLSSQKAVLTSFGMTLFGIFDIPVFWPILLIYFIVLMFLTMKRQVKHMIKHKYVPWNWGKAKYQGSGSANGGGKSYKNSK